VNTTNPPAPPPLYAPPGLFSTPESSDPFPAWVASTFPDLDALARQHRAVVHHQAFPSSAPLLRLLFVYVLGSLSLQTTAVWAGAALGLRIGDEGLRERFLASEGWLRALLEQVMARLAARAGALGSHDLRLLDGSMVCSLGKDPIRLRLHATFSLSALAPVGLLLTDESQGERLALSECRPLDTLAADRGYSWPTPLVDARQRGEHVLVRAQLQHLKPLSPQGQALDLKEVLRRAATMMVDQPIVVRAADLREVSLRLVVVALPTEQAARARQRQRDNAKRRGRTPSELSLALAGFFAVVTSWEAAQVPARQVLAAYGLRWQIELFFKRCKSLQRLAVTRKVSAAMAKVIVLTHVLLLALTELRRPANLTMYGIPGKSRPVSLWQVTAVLATMWWPLVFKALDETTLSEQLDRLRARRRKKRSYALDVVRELLTGRPWAVEERGERQETPAAA
jgi:hypothetical protein